MNIGEVVEVNLTGTATYMVALKDGFQDVQQTVGDLLRYAYSNNQKAIPLSPNAIADHKNPVEPARPQLYPERDPRPRSSRTPTTP